MTPALLDICVTHARVSAPQECCGLLVAGPEHHATYIPCRNLAPAGKQFAIHPDDWARVEDSEVIVGVVHSHTGSVEPSRADREAQARGGVPWWIVTPDGGWHRLGAAPLEGRRFCWGVQDCYTLAQDALGGLPEEVRRYRFWVDSDPFSEHEALGFREVRGLPEPGDVLLFSVRGQGRINHCGVYLGEGQMLHHLPGRLSRKEPVGAWVRVLQKIVRRPA